jgi:uncharacterized membrane protein YkvA (DUF1232 family)
MSAMRDWAQRVKRDLVAVAGAVRDRRTPWPARLLGVCVVAYALSPIDLIPDAIPVLGLLDDLILVPLGLWLVIRLVPPSVLAEHRERARGVARLPVSRTAGLVIVALWAALLIGTGIWVWRAMAS